MAQIENQKNQTHSSLTAILIIVLIVAAFLGAISSFFYPTLSNLLSGGTYVSGGGVIYNAIYVILMIVTDTLYLFGGGVMAFGAILVAIRFVQLKLKDPFQPSFSTRYLSGYLTLGLNFFIGAELVRTVVVRTYEEFALLILVIGSRGLFSLILYLERRWHGTAETE